MINTGTLAKAMHQIAEQKGDFWLFGMFMRADASGTCDLVVAAPWLESGKLKALSEFVALLSDAIGENAVAEFGRVATLPSDSEFLKFIVANVEPVEHEVRISSPDLRARGIEDAVLFQVRKPGANRSKERVHATNRR